MDATSINQLPVLGGVGGWALRKRMPVLPKQTTETPDRLLPLLNLLTCLVSYSAVTRNQCLSKTTTLDSLVKWLSSKDMAVRGSACSVIRSLSRSVKGLRTGLWDAGVGNALLQLVEDAYEESENGMDTDDTLDVLSTAVATICNVVLDFSPMKGVRLLADLLTVKDGGGAPADAANFNVLDSTFQRAIETECNLGGQKYVVPVEWQHKATHCQSLDVSNLVEVVSAR